MHYRSTREIDTLQRKFERGTLALEEWSHSAHLALCCRYLMQDPRATESMLRDGIQSLNRANGVITTRASGYHETLTLFWIAKVRALLEVCEGDELAVINAIVLGLSDKKLVLFHYSRQRILSDAARKGWCEPDLRPLPKLEGSRWTLPQRMLPGAARRCA